MNLYKNYFKMIKSGFFNKSITCALITITYSIFISFYNIPPTIDFFINITTLFFLCFISTLTISFEITDSKYQLYLKLPIKSSSILKVIYLHIYTIYISGIVANLILFFIFNNKASLMILLSLLLLILTFNLFLPKSASNQFKLGLLENTDGTVLLFSMLFISPIVWFFILRVANKLNLSINFRVLGLLFVVILLTLTFSTTKLSYKNTLKKVL